MTTLQTLFPTPAAPGRGRHLAALALHAASVGLGHLARRLLQVRPTAPQAEPVLEFHAGQLYADGRLVGTVPGVQRL